MNLKPSELIENCVIKSCNADLKMVKNAAIFRDKNNIVYIKHYEVIIFAYDEKNNICEIDFNCSPTSNRQINFALSYYGLSLAQCIDKHEGSKMNYSGSLY